LGLGFLAAAIAYTVFGIMYLVEDYTVCNDCKGSNLWGYALTTIVFCTISGKYCIYIQRDKSKMKLWVYILLMTILGIIYGGFAIWGGIELFEKSCHAVENSHLWTWGTCAFGLQCASAFLLLSSLLCLIFYTLYTLCINMVYSVSSVNESLNDIETGESTVVDS